MAGSYPGINLSKHCGFTSNTDYPSLFQCPASLNNAILSCQRSGKKVLIALGGSVVSYKGIPSDDNATELANRIWNLFLGGSNEQSLRPFGRFGNFDITFLHLSYLPYTGKGSESVDHQNLSVNFSILQILYSWEL